MGVRVRDGVDVGVGESARGVEEEGQVGEEVAVRACVEVNVEVEVGMEDGVEDGVEEELVTIPPSARESEKPPRSKLMDARAMTIPRNTCRRLFIINSLQVTLPPPASGR